MAIVIKKRVSLEFLGEEYKDAYLVFRSIPAIEFDEVLAKLKKIESSEDSQLMFLVDLLKEFFVSGEFPDDDNNLQTVIAEDIGQLDPESIIECFKIFTGQEIDPKAETPLTSSSPTVESPPENS